MGRPAVDRTGHVYGQLTVVQRSDRTNAAKQTFWECRCSCGRTVIARGNALQAGQKSCGCGIRPAVLAATKKHGLYKSSEYNIWTHIIQRCYNPNSPLFARYGAKGLLVADRWRSFPNFYADMGPRPSPKHSIDRIDNAKGYTPENCRWSDYFQQNRNRALSKFIEWNGETLTVSEWSRKLGVTRNTIKNRWNWYHSLDPVSSSQWVQKRATRRLGTLTPA